MAKIAYTICVLLAILFCAYSCLAQTCVEQAYTAEMGKREATGNNDGAHICEYMKAVKLSCNKGYAYCTSGVKWVFDQCGIKTTITAWSPSAHNPKNIVMMHGKYIKEPKPGDVFTIWSVSKKRIAHGSFFHRKVNETIYITAEFNTNSGGSRDGDGNYFRRRSIHATYSITRWTE